VRPRRSCGPSGRPLNFPLDAAPESTAVRELSQHLVAEPAMAHCPEGPRWVLARKGWRRVPSLRGVRDAVSRIISHDHETRLLCLRATHSHNHRRAYPSLCLPLPRMSKAHRQRFRSAGALSCDFRTNGWKVERLHSCGRLWWEDQFSLLPQLRFDRLVHT